jgi:hypothetical protein
MGNVNIYTAWISMLAGSLAGSISGLFFHKQEWSGGYTSWRRRMLRLGHISLFGIAFINLAFVFTASHLNISEGILVPSRLLVVGNVTMPLVCYLAAYKSFFRHFFFIPVLCIILAMFIFILGGGML